MGQKHTSKYCSRCRVKVMAVGKTPNHILHLLMSVVTAGLWLPVWLIIGLCSGGGYRCTTCGNSV